MRQPSKVDAGQGMKPWLPIALPIAMLGVVVFVSPVEAQRRVAVRSVSAARMGTGVHPRPGPRTSFGYAGRGRRFFPGWGWGGAYLPPPYYYDPYGYEYEPSMTEAPPPEAIVRPAQQAPPPRLPDSLLLEREGNQWVRVTTYGQSPAPAQPPQPNLEQAPSPQATIPSRHEAAEPARELSPAVLVFRDGHEEEVEHYTIVGTTLYTRADYWTSGSWTRRIEIADLDIPATLKVNQERGVRFSLPSGPYEVVTRP